MTCDSFWGGARPEECRFVFETRSVWLRPAHEQFPLSSFGPLQTRPRHAVGLHKPFGADCLSQRAATTCPHCCLRHKSAVFVMGGRRSSAHLRNHIKPRRRWPPPLPTNGLYVRDRCLLIPNCGRRLLSPRILFRIQEGRVFSNQTHP